MGTISLPLWANILSMVVGLAIIVAMALWVAHNDEKKKSEIKAKSKG